MRSRSNLLLRTARRATPSPFRVKVAVFMLPLLLPVGQNLSQQPAEADGGPAADRVVEAAGASAGGRGNLEPVAAVSPAWTDPEPKP